MRKIILGLALFMGLVFGGALAYAQDEINAFEEKCDRGDADACHDLGMTYVMGGGV